MNKTNKIIPKILLISKMECKPCKGAKFILHRIKQRYDVEVKGIYMNSTNKTEILELYNVSDDKIPAVLINGKLAFFSKIKESEIRKALDQIITEKN